MKKYLTKKMTALVIVLSGIAFFAWLLCFRFPAEYIDAQAQQGREYQLAGRAGDRGSLIFDCRQGPPDTRIDFTGGEIASVFDDLQNIGPYDIDTNGPLFCTARPETVSYDSIDGKTVFTGGSFTDGQGVRREDAFPSVINRLVAGGDGGRAAMAVNLATRDESFLSIYTRVMALIDHQPREIVFVWTPACAISESGAAGDNDCRGLIDVRNPFSGLPAGPVPLFDMLGALRQLRLSRTHALAGCTRLYDEHSENVALQHVMMREMSTAALSRNVEFSVVLFPLMPNHHGGYPLAGVHERMKSFLDSAGIKNVDISGMPAEAGGRDMAAHPYARRPGAEAHYMAARRLIPWLGFDAARTHGDSPAAQTHVPGGNGISEKYPPSMRNTVSGYVFFYLVFVFITGAAALVLILSREMPSLLSGVINNPGTAVSMALILGLGVTIRIILSPHDHLILNNEYNLMRVLEMWSAGVFDANTTGIFPGHIAPYFLPALIFGVSPGVTHWTAIAISTASTAMMFPLARRLSGRTAAGLAASFLFACAPLSIRYSGTVEAAAANMFILQICVLALFYGAGKRTFAGALLFASALGAALFTRIHNLPFALLLAALWFVFYGSRSGHPPLRSFRAGVAASLKKRRNRLPAATAVMGFVVFAFFIFNIIAHNTYEKDTVALSDSIAKNLLPNLRFFADFGHMVAFTTPLAVAGVLFLCFTNAGGTGKSLPAFLAIAWIIIYFSCHLLRYDGVYNAYDIAKQMNVAPMVWRTESRYVLDILCPLLALAAAGVTALCAIAADRALRITLAALFIAAYLAAPFAYRHMIERHTFISLLTKQAVEDVSRHPAGAVVTNSRMIAQALDIDLNIKARTAYDKSGFASACERHDTCLAVLYSENTRGPEFDIAARPGCGLSLVSYYDEILFCSRDQARALPASLFKQPGFEAEGLMPFIKQVNP